MDILPGTIGITTEGEEVVVWSIKGSMALCKGVGPKKEELIIVPVESILPFDNIFRIIGEGIMLAEISRLRANLQAKANQKK